MGDHMNKEDIIRMAREASTTSWCYMPTTLSELEQFAALVAAAEREACAKVCESLWNYPENGMATEEECYGKECAVAIRARGQA